VTELNRKDVEDLIMMLDRLFTHQIFPPKELGKSEYSAPKAGIAKQISNPTLSSRQRPNLSE
jgi:hypothetical protein